MANRAQRRAVMSDARRRGSWVWAARHLPEGVASAWGRPLGAHVNDFYAVLAYEAETSWGTILHLAIRRHDGQSDVPWADKQRIKNELAGLERVAVEVFPPTSELVDNANLYHLWVMPEDFSLPFGLPPESGRADAAAFGGLL